MEEAWIPDHGASIFVESTGEGPTALVMPVAWGMSHDFYRELLGDLELSLRLTHFDPHGTGRSGPRTAGWSPANIVDEAETVREHLGHEQVILFGHASGAFLSIAYALDHPEHATALILSNPFASVQRARELSHDRLEATPNWNAFQKRVSEIRRVELSSEERFRATFKEQRAVDLLDYGPHYFAMADAADAATFNPSMTDDEHTDFLDELSLIDAPVLIITGRYDPIVPVEESRLMAAEFPYVRLIELGASAHYPFVEQPEEFSYAVRTFVEELQSDDTEEPEPWPADLPHS